MNTVRNLIEVPNFGCSYKECCYESETGLTRDNVDEINIEKDWFTNYTYIGVEKVDFVGNRIKLRVPVAVRADMSFRLHQRTVYGEWAYSPWIHVKVIYAVHSDPYYEEQLRLRVDGQVFNNTVNVNSTKTNSTGYSASGFKGMNGMDVVNETIVEEIENFTLDAD